MGHLERHMQTPIGGHPRSPHQRRYGKYGKCNYGSSRLTKENSKKDQGGKKYLKSAHGVGLRCMSLSGEGPRRNDETKERQGKSEEPGLADVGIQRIQKATTLVHEGHVRRAVRSLLSDGIPSISATTIANLKSLHPRGPELLPSCPEEAPILMRIDRDVLKNIVTRELANGSAPGRSGWTGDLLKALVDDEQCLDGMVALTMSIANGKVRGKAKAALLCSVLVGLGKPGGGIRPIAMGEAFYKLAATYMLRLVNESARSALGPGQFAFAPGGAEAAVICLRTAMFEHPGWWVMACDIKNAFNSRDRGDILKILYQHSDLAGIWRIADWAYGQPSDLLMVN